MTRKLNLALDCCRARQDVLIDEEGIRQSKLNELRKNVVCLKCDCLVIITFTHRNSGVSVVEQEVIDPAPY